MNIIPTWMLILGAVLGVVVAVAPSRYLDAGLTYLKRVAVMLLRFCDFFKSTAFANGDRTIKRIVQTESLDDLEQIFGDFMSLTHRYRTEKVFAAYWLKRGKLEGKRLDEAWSAMAKAGVAHSKGSADNDPDPEFWDRVIMEATLDLQTQIFPKAAIRR